MATDIQSFVERTKEEDMLLYEYRHHRLLESPFKLYPCSPFKLYPCDVCALPTWTYPCPFCGHFPIYEDEVPINLYKHQGWIPYEHYEKMVMEHNNYAAFYFDYQKKKSIYGRDFGYAALTDAIVEEAQYIEGCPSPREIWREVTLKKRSFR